MAQVDGMADPADTTKPSERALQVAESELRAAGVLSPEHGECVRPPGGTDSKDDATARYVSLSC